MERYQSKEKDLRVVFIDVGKTYDRVSREMLWKILEKKGVCVAYIRTIQDMYERVTIIMRTPRGEIKDILIVI